MIDKAQRGIRGALFLASYRLGQTRVRHPPLVLNVEPTNRCNLRCPICPVSQQEQRPWVKRGFMSMELAEAVAKEVAAFRPLVAVNMGGESTLHPRLAEMIICFHRVGCYVFLDTNATRLTPTLSEALVNSGLDEIALCLDGDGSADSYEAIRVRARFDSTVNGIRTFLDTRRRLGSDRPRTIVKNIQYFRSDGGLRFPVALKRLFEDHPPDGYRATYADYWPGKHVDGLKTPYEIQPYASGAYRACTNLWKKLAISWDGKVYACCLDLDRTTYVGDVTIDGVMGVWNSPRMQELRLIHRQGRQAELALCSRCTMIQRPPQGRLAGLLKWRAERFTPFRDETTHERS